MDLDRIEHSVYIAASPERVWETITKPELIAQWFGDGGAEVDLRAGGAMSLSWTQWGTVHGVVTEVDPPRAFGFRWASAMNTPATDENCTDVRFVIEPDGTGTTLTVVESGFDSAGVGDATARRAENTEGWKSELGELVALFTPVPQ